MVAVDTQGHGFSIFELLSNSDFEVGDEVSWQGDTPVAHAKCRNITKGTTTEVYFQNHWVTPQQLPQQLLL